MYALSNIFALASIPVLLTIPMVIAAVLGALQPLTVRNKYARAVAVREAKAGLWLLAKAYLSFLAVMAFVTLATAMSMGA